jgi:hypothetical protein
MFIILPPLLRIMDFNELFGKASGNKDNVLDELNVLALNIQVLNQSLATSNIGDDPVLRKKISEVVDHINFLYGQISKIQKNVDSNIDKGFESIAVYFRDVEKRIDIIAQLANQLYQINQVELIRMQDNIDALDKIVSSNKELWQRLNTMKIEMLKNPKREKFKVFANDLATGELKETEIKDVSSLVKQTDAIVKKIEEN